MRRLRCIGADLVPHPAQAMGALMTHDHEDKRHDRRGPADNDRISHFSPERLAANSFETSAEYLEYDTSSGQFLEIVIPLLLVKISRRRNINHHRLPGLFVFYAQLAY